MVERERGGTPSTSVSITAWLIARWAIVPAGVAYLAVLVLRAPDLAAQLAWNADAATPAVVAETLSQPGPHGHIAVEQPGYTWLGVAGHHLPGWVGVNGLLPLLGVLAGVVLLALTADRLGGRWAAVIALGVAGAAPAVVLLTEVAPAFHGMSWTVMPALDWLLVELCLRGSGRRPRRAFAAAAAIAVVGGLVAASDVFVVLVGFIPMAVAAALLAVRRPGPARRTVLAWTGSVCLGAAAVAGLTHLAMARADFAAALPTPPGGGYLSAGALPEHLRVLGRGLLDLGGGLPLEVNGQADPAALALAVLLVAGFALLALAGARNGLRAPGADDDDALAAARFVHVVFWLAGAALLVGAFVAGNLVAPGGDSPPWVRLVSPERYLTPLLYVVAALVPLAPRSARGRAAVGIAAGVAVAWSTLGVEHAWSAAAFRPANTTDLPAVAALLEAHGLHHGYASYWDAQPLTLTSGGGLTVRPAAEDGWCGVSGRVLCAHVMNGVTGWFTVQPGPSFVIVDPGADYLKAPPPPGLGTPTGVWQVGRLSVYAYADDVLARFATSCSGRADHRC